ncbi:serine/threonine protein phosphatase [Hymenobacter sp. BT683]|uniref:Serine/threonine protein phosphatase n=1 Tax=Hymenobacter jeongseonensis TaxID=2791027 RepID=A0ABS0IFW2_9BACT|nr:metallophosphoesterase [Hymenobacter jeongseonensis]MBF9237258.1 serine/threonine protein phosphatase [Hymenobacter jeongseonensis]
MNLFIIGDVHGCVNTFSEVLTHWRPATEQLIQVGDLVDRGRHSPETVELARTLSEQHPDSTTFLMGNHEHAMLQHFGPAGPYPDWLLWGGRETVHQYKSCPKMLAKHLPWLAQRPLRWQNDCVVVSHAGLADSPHALEPDHPDGLLWRRGPLRKLPQLQVVGHTPTANGQLLADAATNTLYIDTGAYLKRNLAGVRLSPTGDLLDTILVPTHPEDLY